MADEGGRIVSENTKIEWADHTFNPWEGCQKVGPGCDHCYAEARNARFAGGTAVNWGPGAPRRRTSVANWKLPLKWNREAQRLGIRYRVFCASLADVFDNEVPTAWRHELFILISETPNLDWLLLTKRIGNVRAMLPIWYEDPQAWEGGGGVAHHNVWIGATIVNQPEADRDLPKLERVPAARHFVSIEPMLGPIDLQLMQYHDSDHRDEAGRIVANTRRRWLRWVIVGGESSPGARPMHPDWARSLRDQCLAAGVPFLFKQWGAWEPANNLPKETLLPAKRWGYVCEHGGPVDQGFGPFRNETAHHELMGNVGKKAAGRLLDGRTWDEVPS